MRLDTGKEMHGMIEAEITVTRAGAGTEQPLGVTGSQQQQHIPIEGVNGAWKVCLVLVGSLLGEAVIDEAS